MPAGAHVVGSTPYLPGDRTHSGGTAVVVGKAVDAPYTTITKGIAHHLGKGIQQLLKDVGIQL